MWTENVTWFSNEEGKKGRIEAGQLADLVVPDRDYFACPEARSPTSTALLTDGRAARSSTAPATSQPLDEGAPPPAMPDWSPVRRFGGYAAWGDTEARRLQKALRQAAHVLRLRQRCSVHGHEHATAWSSKLPVADLKSFWGALGCACWAV